MDSFMLGMCKSQIFKIKLMEKNLISIQAFIFKLNSTVHIRSKQ
jgi:hypothetical protein